MHPHSHPHIHTHTQYCAHTRTHAQVYVYDLEAWSHAPARVYRVGHRVKGAAGGNYSLCFSCAAVPTLVAGSAYGVLRGWALPKPDTVGWEVRVRGNGGA